MKDNCFTIAITRHKDKCPATQGRYNVNTPDDIHWCDDMWEVVSVIRQYLSDKTEYGERDGVKST